MVVQFTSFGKPRSFNLSYTTKENGTDIPLVIHRAPLGTHERFIGFLLEHYAGKFPVWLSPVQVKILPISDKYADYENTVLQKLKNADIRADIDDRQEKIGKKIRDAEMMKIPYMLIVGEKEMNENKVSVRCQGVGDTGAEDADEFVKMIKGEIAERKNVESPFTEGMTQ